jgi:hypothetical protein
VCSKSLLAVGRKFTPLHLKAAMEHRTALPERQTSVRVVTEPDISSLNRYRPKIVVTNVELEAEARDVAISGEFLSVRYTNEICT